MSTCSCAPVATSYQACMEGSDARNAPDLADLVTIPVVVAYFGKRRGAPAARRDREERDPDGADRAITRAASIFSNTHCGSAVVQALGFCFNAVMHYWIARKSRSRTSRRRIRCDAPPASPRRLWERSPDQGLPLGAHGLRRPGVASRERGDRQLRQLVV